MSSSASKVPPIELRKTIRGHTKQVCSAVYLPDGQRIVTCSADGSLRLWDLESSRQIGEDWRGDNNNAVWSMALSPNGKTIASGSGGSGYNVRLWDVETRNGIAKWTGHTRIVCALCWSADGGRVASGSWDGTARVWDVASSKNILTIETGHDWVNAVIYSPGTSKLATGGDKDVAVKIWDAETGELPHRIEQGRRRGVVSSLGCTSDGKKIIFSSGGSIMMFDSATGSWQQIAVLEGHTQTVTSISLSQNNRFLASASDDKTARLWDLDTYLQVGVTIQHKNDSLLTALSPDGKVLVTACHDKNAYIWDVHATNTTDKLDQKASQDDPGIQRTPRSSLDNKSFLEADATQYPGQFGGVDELSPTFFHGMETDVNPSPGGGTHSHSSANALLTRISSLLHRIRPESGESDELLQPSGSSLFHLHALLARLSSFTHSSPPENDAPDEPQQPSTPSWVDPRLLLASLSSFFHRSRLNTANEAEPHPTTSPSSRPDAPITRLSSLFRTRPHTDKLAQLPSQPHVVEVAAMRNKQALFVARGPQFEKEKRAYEQQKLHAQAQASSSHTQPANTSTSTTPPAQGTAATQSPPIPWWAQVVLFLCCAFPPYDNGHQRS